MSSYSTGITGVAQGGCSCHNAAPSANTIIALDGLPTSGYQNNTTYTLTVTATNTEITEPLPRHGFDLIASDGEFIATSGTTLNGLTEILHSTPQVANSGTASWTFEWTSPLTGSLPITFVLACNCTNGDGINGTEDEWNQLITTVNSATPPSSILNLKLFLEGYYASQSFMNPALYNQGFSSDPSITDSIIVELKDPLTNLTVMSVPTILEVDGSATVDLGTLVGSYYIAISHRNSVLTWSSNPVAISTGTTFYDFSSSSSQAFGDNLKEIEPNIWAIFSGDLNQDENLDLLDIASVELDINNFEFGHLPSDVNGDGNVDLLDSPIIEDNVNNFVFSSHP